MKNVNIKLNAGAIVLGMFAVVSWVGVKIATLVTGAKSQKKLLKFVDEYTDGCLKKMEKIIKIMEEY